MPSRSLHLVPASSSQDFSSTSQVAIAFVPRILSTPSAWPQAAWLSPIATKGLSVLTFSPGWSGLKSLGICRRKRDSHLVVLWPTLPGLSGSSLLLMCYLFGHPIGLAVTFTQQWLSSGALSLDRASYPPGTPHEPSRCCQELSHTASLLPRRDSSAFLHRRGSGFLPRNLPARPTLI